MPRYLRRPALLLVCILMTSCAHGQTTSTIASHSVLPITLGQSIVALNGPWRFHTGDSPNSDSSRPLWASPEFDDSQWERVDLSPVAGSASPLDYVPGWVPGWETKGHFGYWGYAWYRIRVQVVAAPNVRLAIQAPSHFDDGYQFFAGGSLVGSFGNFSERARPPLVYAEQPQMFLLPQPSEGNTSHTSPETQVLAFRVWMTPSSLGKLSGGLHDAPLIGEAGAVKAHYRSVWLQRIRQQAFTAITAVMFLLLAIVACSIGFLDRKDRVYWWVMAVFFTMVVGTVETLAVSWTQLQTLETVSIVMGVFFWPLWFFGWVMVWWVWFQLCNPVWMPRLIGGLTLLYLIVSLPRSRVEGVPYWISVASYVALICIRCFSLLLILYIVVRGVKARGREGWLALPAVLIAVAAIFEEELLSWGIFLRLGIHRFWYAFGSRIYLVEVANLISTIMMFALLLRRLLLSIRRQRELALDVKQAQEVQHVLLPETIHVPGLTIQTEYRPAREVGGDFFQILPHPLDGSVLIVAGDVAGKGLQAGMLVAVLVGAIHSTVECNPDPQFVLGALNRRLLGRGDAAATCLAMRIEADGQVTLANAGHLAPYLNGIEVEMEGALPLGMIGAADFPVSHFQFRAGDTLTLISDGILEAQDKSGQLFGFDRIRDLLTKRPSADYIASAAQSFGQEDDISVVSISRSACVDNI